MFILFEFYENKTKHILFNLYWCYEMNEWILFEILKINQWTNDQNQMIHSEILTVRIMIISF